MNKKGILSWLWIAIVSIFIFHLWKMEILIISEVISLIMTIEITALVFRGVDFSCGDKDHKKICYKKIAFARNVAYAIIIFLFLLTPISPITVSIGLLLFSTTLLIFEMCFFCVWQRFCHAQKKMKNRND